MALLASALFVTARPVAGIGADDPRVYVEASHSLLDGAYRSPSEPGGVPRYPPGFPVMLAPFVAAAGDDGARAASVLIGGALTALVWWSAHRVAGARASALAALFWMLSPLLRDYATEVMSDPAAAAMVMLAFLAALADRWVLVALALGWSCWIRLIHVPFLLGLGRRPPAWLAAVLTLVPLAAFQLAVYGRLAGYAEDQAQFSVGNIFGGTSLLYMGRPSPWPNWQFVPGMLGGLRGGVVPALVVVAGYELWTRRDEAAARFAAWIIVANVLVYLPYFFQAARFMVPGACLVVVYGACGVVRLVDRVSSGRERGASRNAPGFEVTH